MGLARAVQVTRNLVLAGGVAAGLAVTDPAVFLVQLAQRAPAKVRGPLGRVLEGSPWVGGRALGGKLLGTADVDAQLAAVLAADTGGGSRSPSVRLAWEVAASSGALPDELVEKMPPATRARALWSRGMVDAAVAAARATGSRRFAAKFASEADLLNPDWSVTVPAPGPEAPSRGKAVLHVLTNSLPETQSGYTLRTQRLLQALADAGTEVVAVTRVGYPVAVGKFFGRDEARVGSIAYRRLLPWALPSSQTGRLNLWAQRAAQVVQKALGGRPALVHTTTHYHNGLVAAALAKAWGVPWVYEVRGVLEETWLSKQPESQQESARLSQRFARTRARENQLMGLADHVLTLSGTMKKALVARGVPAEKITVVPNAVDEALLAESLAPEDARARFGLPADGFWVGSVSSLVPYEGFDTLLRAAALLRERGVDVRVLLAGDGTDRPRLERLAQELGLGEKAVFLGRISPDQAKIAHQALNVFVVPRTDDIVCRTVTPLKPIEAMAVGRPVVVSDLPPLVELVQNGITAPTGLVAEAESAESFAQALATLAQDVAAASSYARAGREFAATRTWAQNARIVRDLYRSLGL